MSVPRPGARCLVLLALLALCLLALIEPGLAVAQSGAGEKVGRELGSWGRGILLAVAGLAGLAALGRRDVSGLVVLGIIVLVLGGFFFAPGVVEAFVQGFWRTVSG